MEVEIRLIDELKGNGLFAKSNIKKGSVILEETPIVCVQFSWNAAYGYKACDHCLRDDSKNLSNEDILIPNVQVVNYMPDLHIEQGDEIDHWNPNNEYESPLETAEENVRRLSAKRDIVLPHPECCTTNKSTIISCNMCGTEFCSPQCLKTALEQYHTILCKQERVDDENHPLNILNETWKQLHYPPELSSIMIIPRILATILQSPNREHAIAQFFSFCHKSVNEDAEITHKFLSSKFSDQVSTLQDLIAKAVPNNGIEQLLMPDGFQSLLALIATNGQGVGTSPFSQWVSKVTDLPLSDDDKSSLDTLIETLYDAIDTQSGIFLDNEGIALYVMQSKSNHSCAPNTEASFLHNNSTMSLVALTDIEAGEEICISYLDECLLHRSRHSRQKVLKENYLFVCNCQKCLSEADDPDVTSEEEMSE